MTIFRQKKIDTSHIKVNLKPIFGIKPTIYIPVFYSLLFICIISIILCGIFKQLSKIEITSTPSKASVYIDGIRVGSTPLKLENSPVEIEIKKEFFESQKVNINKKTHIKLKSQDGKKILISSYKELSKWSLTNNTSSYKNRIPNIFSKSISDYLNSENFSNQIAEDYTISSIKNVTNQYLFSDYLRGVSILMSDNRLPSISSLKKSLLLVNKIIEESPNTPILFYNKILLNDEINKSSKIIKSLDDRHKSDINKKVISFLGENRDFKNSDFTFKSIPESNIKPLGVKFIHNIKQDSFYISEDMVSRESYFKFIKDNPKWSLDNKDLLIKENLVDNYYLSSSSNEKYITNVSYYAALEWCKWANSYYDIPDGYVFSLPTENMWHAAMLNESIKEIEAWQWTSEGFYLYDHFLTDKNGKFLEEFTSIDQRLVVGDNKYNKKKESGRGVQNATWCTPFLSFRPVLIKE